MPTAPSSGFCLNEPPEPVKLLPPETGWRFVAGIWQVRSAGGLARRAASMLQVRLVRNGSVDRSPDHHGRQDVGSERLGGCGIPLCAPPLPDAGEEGPGSCGKDNVRDVGVGESEVAQRVDVPLLDRRRVERHLRCERIDGAVLLAETCTARVLRYGGHGGLVSALVAEELRVRG